MVLGGRRGLRPSLSLVCPAAGLDKPCWRMSVEDGGEDILDAFKRVNIEVSCSLTLLVSS